MAPTLDQPNYILPRTGPKQFSIPEINKVADDNKHVNTPCNEMITCPTVVTTLLGKERHDC